MGIDQTFDNAKEKPKMNTNKPTTELFETFFPTGYLSTITKATRITKITVTILENVYIKCKKPRNIISGVTNSHISDHPPVFVFTRKEKKKTASRPGEPLKIKSRSITDNKSKS